MSDDIAPHLWLKIQIPIKTALSLNDLAITGVKRRSFDLSRPLLLGGLLPLPVGQPIVRRLLLQIIERHAA